MFTYTEEKIFTEKQIQQLFLSVFFGHGEWSSYSDLQLWEYAVVRLEDEK